MRINDVHICTYAYRHRAHLNKLHTNLYCCYCCWPWFLMQQLSHIRKKYTQNKIEKTNACMYICICDHDLLVHAFATTATTQVLNSCAFDRNVYVRNTYNVLHNIINNNWIYVGMQDWSMFVKFKNTYLPTNTNKSIYYTRNKQLLNM